MQDSRASVTSSPALTKLPIKTPDFLDRISMVTYGYGIVRDLKVMGMITIMIMMMIMIP